MQRRLIALRGPRKGETFEISERGLSLGRATENDVFLADKSVSREHCVIQVQDGAYCLRDLGSQNKTRLNGTAVNEQILQPGDRLGIGESVFLFAGEEDSLRFPTDAVSIGDDAMDGATLLNVELPVVGPPASDTRDLEVLLKIAMGLGAITDPESLCWQLLGMIFDAVPAERGAILFATGDPVDFIPAAAWNQGEGQIDTVHVSRTILRQVATARAGTLARGGRTRIFGPGKGPEDPQVQAVLCAPMVADNRMIGAIYLDTSNPENGLEQRHLELIVAIASMAALAVQNARSHSRLLAQNELLRKDLRLATDMLGQSPAMLGVYKFIGKVAATDSTVLIHGESGTGKELAARAIHHNSGRANGPFVAINCAALSENLLESELFGHEKGAFTSAHAQKRGQIELASGGTIFLDEIGELAPGMQAKLLRVLQEREITRVGGTRPIKVDVRVLSATNRDLGEAVASGRFRQDLFYRLNVVSLTLPPLRERRSDIPLLAEHFAAKYGEKCKRRVLGISPEAKVLLMHYDWPGNVRELENAIERAIVLGSADMIVPDDLPDMVVEHPADAGELTGYHQAVADFKRQLIREAVAKAKGNITGAAKSLGIHPNYLHRLIRNLEIRALLKQAS